jgi:predicted Fe-Mo cluster-binding NifX family protein
MSAHKPDSVRTGFPLKLAVASKDGIAISEHFGHAKQFSIYIVSPDTCDFQEIREVAHYCLGQHSDESAMGGILEAIRDCHAVFVARIGDGPTDKVHAIGVRAVSEYAYAAIEESLLDYARRTAAGEDIG